MWVRIMLVLSLCSLTPSPPYFNLPYTVHCMRLSHSGDRCDRRRGHVPPLQIDIMGLLFTFTLN